MAILGPNDPRAVRKSMIVTRPGKFTWHVIYDGISYRVTQRQDGYFIEETYGSYAQLWPVEKMDRRFPNWRREFSKAW